MFPIPTAFRLALTLLVCATPHETRSQSHPDLFQFDDGRPVESAGDWAERREEMKELILFHQYGRVPPPPERVTAEITSRKRHESGLGDAYRITLTIHGPESLPMRIALYKPDLEGKRPAILREEGTLGRTRQIPMFLENGYIFIEFARHDLDPDKKDVVGPAQAAYPDYDWATLAVWAWAGSRVVDYLETRDDIDLERLAITGHSRGGKMALLAGALDERFALVVPNGSGAGGAGSYRVLGPGAESLAMNDKPHWYHNRILDFAFAEDQLPFDQHFLKALVAPRALLCTESTDDLFANPVGTEWSSVAAKEAFDFLGVPEQTGLVYRRGKHDSNDEDWRTLLEFAQWRFFGIEPENPERFWRTPFAKGDHPINSGENPEPTSGDSPETAYAPINAVQARDDFDHFGQGAFGSIDAPMDLATRKVTNHQYARFLQAVAATNDPHNLYDPRMASHEKGGIVMTMEGTRRRYQVPAARADQPVNFVRWSDAARYCNWRHHGSPTDNVAATVTENGAYDLSGPFPTTRRTLVARYFLPTEDEWYHAAYFDPTTQAYTHFPEVGGEPLPVGGDSGISPNGVQGMNDGVWEWLENPVTALHRAVRSGVWFQGNNRQAAGRFYSNDDLELANIGFRIGRLPEDGAP